MLNFTSAVCTLKCTDLLIEIAAGFPVGIRIVDFADEGTQPRLDAVIGILRKQIVLRNEYAAFKRTCIKMEQGFS